MIRLPWFKSFRSLAISALESLWYKAHPLAYVLWPLALIMQGISGLRRHYLQKKQRVIDLPIIVVGNLSVGGVGKTPLVIAIAKHLTAKGLRVGIISRGYGASLKDFPHEIREEDSAQQVGDEPKLIAIKTLCPVVIAPNRLMAVRMLMSKHRCQVIISDDGLQHYALPRRVEIAVVDGLRGLGNGFCLPAGPLREPPKRLNTVDFIVINGSMSLQRLKSLGHHPLYGMKMLSQMPLSLSEQKPVSWASLDKPLSVVAAIGHPERFFAMFDRLGMDYKAYRFPDHYQYRAEDLMALSGSIVMTEKDAVKCVNFVRKSMYYVPVEAELSDEFWTKLYAKIS